MYSPSQYSDCLWDDWGVPQVGHTALPCLLVHRWAAHRALPQPLADESDSQGGRAAEPAGQVSGRGRYCHGHGLGHCYYLPGPGY